MKTFAIGDIHGCLHELEKILDYVERNKNEGDKIIFTGDYVDRGLHSAQVIDRLIAIRDKYAGDVTFLRGNHEDMFCAYLRANGRTDQLDGMFASMFHYNGGWSTMASYAGVDIPPLAQFVSLDLEGQELVTEKIRNAATEAQMIKNVPDTHIEFLKGLKLYHDTENILFVHAGLNPYISLEQNTDFDFTWVQDNRPRFFSQIRSKPWHKLLVHGHTIIRPNEVKAHLEGSNRINIDTGCCAGGRLTCLIIEDGVEPIDWAIVQSDFDKLYFTK